MKTSTMPIVPGRSGRWRARTSCHCHSGMTSDRTVSTTHRTACPHGSIPDDASHHDQNGKDQLDSVAAGRDIFDFMLRCHVSSLEICSLRLP